MTRARVVALAVAPLLMTSTVQAPAPQHSVPTREQPVVRMEGPNKKQVQLTQMRLWQEFKERQRELAAESRKRAAARRERRQRRIETARLRGVAAVLARARSLLGVPYTWGGASASALDCSGFTMLSYAAAGLHLPHASWLQPSFGYRVGTPRPGDLVHWPGHVMIYYGNGLVIGAHRSGTVSSISPIYGSPSFYRMVG